MAEFLVLKLNFEDRNLDPFYHKQGGTQELNKALQLSANEIRNKILDKLQKGGRSGRIYKRKSVTHQASAPGEPPKSDRGGLVQNIGIDLGFLVADVVANTGYSGYLEQGTSKMAPRPYMQPSIEESMPAIDRIFDNALKRMFKL